MLLLFSPPVLALLLVPPLLLVCNPGIDIVQSPRIATHGHTPVVNAVQSPSITATPTTNQARSNGSASTQSPLLNNDAQSCASPSLAGLLQQFLSSHVSSPQPSPSVLVQPAPKIDPNYLFWVMFLVGNISRCQGCGGKIERGPDGKVLPPPNDLVLQHKERVICQNPRSGNFQLSCDLRNVYYHPRLLCLQRKFSAFQPKEHIRASNLVFARLTSKHIDHLKTEFAIEFSIPVSK